MIKSKCKLCSATGKIDKPEPSSLIDDAPIEPLRGKIMCTRCDGKIELTPDEWESKGFPGMIKSNCKLCKATGFLDEPEPIRDLEPPERSLEPPIGKMVCTRCDGRIELTPEEWEAKGFPGMIKSNCKLCSATGFLDDPNPKVPGIDARLGEHPKIPLEVESEDAAAEDAYGTEEMVELE